MAHFAEINKNNEVIRVLVVDNEHENRGQEYLAEELGLGGTWIQTSYNRSFRKNFAGEGYIYSAELDAFIPPQPFSSWTLNEDTCTWEAPVAYPKDGELYVWDEEAADWVAFSPEE